jgi:hypothetical protein
VPLLQVSWTTTARCLSFIVQYKEPLRTAKDLTLVLLLLHLSINPRQHLLSIAILRMCCCSFFGSLSISLFCTHQAQDLPSNVNCPNSFASSSPSNLPLCFHLQTGMQLQVQSAELCNWICC